ncbi:hypothetical protein SLA2020_252580 [Shorea laevis]
MTITRLSPANNNTHFHSPLRTPRATSPPPHAAQNSMTTISSNHHSLSLSPNQTPKSLTLIQKLPRKCQNPQCRRPSSSLGKVKTVPADLPVALDFRFSYPESGPTVSPMD